MDFLSGEINKLKRKAPIEQDSRYVSRGELEKKRLAEYQEQQRKVKAAREAREAEKLARLAEYEAKMKVKQDRALKDKAKTEESMDMVRENLRNFKEPIRLFGEEDAEIRKRLQQVKAKHERLRNSTTALLNEVYSDPPDESLPDEVQLEVVTAWVNSASDDEKNKLHKNLLLLFRGYIRDWQNQLVAMDIREQSIYGQAREHLAHLLLRVKTMNLPSDILTNLSNIGIALKRRDYTAANHAYLQMSIGKAAWPVGVTMVGIHERAQRERVKQVLDSAHILSDETTRQWLQSLKRLITFREKCFPDS